MNNLLFFKKTSSRKLESSDEVYGSKARKSKVSLKSKVKIGEKVKVEKVYGSKPQSLKKHVICPLGHLLTHSLSRVHLELLMGAKKKKRKINE